MALKTFIKSESEVTNRFLRRALWLLPKESSSLTHLQLPSQIHVTGAWLNQLASKHPNIEHLSLTTRCRRLVMDDCQNPFQEFRRLKSLSLELGHKCRDESHPEDILSIGSILNGLKITSLELSGAGVYDEEKERKLGPESQLPSHVTTPNLVQLLVHLRINEGMNFQRAEYLLYHFRHLETLHLRCIGHDYDFDEGVFICEEYPPLIASQHQMSPYLRSITMGLGSVS